jgi:peptidoglycan/LPS O-acetylase OafA/YrhL
MPTPADALKLGSAESGTFDAPAAIAHADHLKYRADIDGMRAVAVLSVIGYHAFPQWITGGFIGVDIFFVISGFLITSIILKGLAAGTFSFADFYGRRARRILPSLLVVFLACFVAGLFMLLDHELRELGKHIAAGAAFVSNFVLWKDSGYFDTAAETKILLHLWSLAIEEQFYIVWPCLLWILHRFGLRPVWLMIAAGLVSFAIGLQYLQTDPTSAFYMPQARFWELLVGALLAYLSLIRLPSAVPTVVSTIGRNILAVVGAGMLGYGFAITNVSSPFPGWYATLPVFGAALLIAAGRDALVNRWLLSIPLLTWIGKISFVAYLWHWPILVFLRIVNDGEASNTARSIAVAATLALAAATHYLVENPVRFGRNRRLVHSGVALATLAAAAIGMSTYLLDGLSWRYQTSPNDLSARVVWGAEPFGTYCSDRVAGVKSSFCVTNPETNVVILGDSHAGAMYYGLATSKDPRFDKPTVIGASSCPPSLGVEWRPGCDVALKAGLEFIAKHPSVKTVILAAYGGFVPDGAEANIPAYVAGYQRTIQQIEALGKRVIVAEDNFTIKQSAQLCAPAPLGIRAHFRKEHGFCQTLTKDDIAPRTAYREVMRQLKAKNPDMVFYDPTSWLCPNGQCSLYKDGRLLISDTDHLSKAGNEFYIRDLIRQLDASTRGR